MNRGTLKLDRICSLKSFLLTSLPTSLRIANYKKAGLQVSDAKRAEFLNRCFQSPEGVEDLGDLSEVSSEKTEALIMNAEVKRKAPSKKKAKSDDDSFEGLKVNMRLLAPTRRTPTLKAV